MRRGKPPVADETENSSAEVDIAALAYRYLDRRLRESQRKALNDHLRRDCDARTKFVRCLLQGVELEELLPEEQATESWQVLMSAELAPAEPDEGSQRSISGVVQEKGSKRTAWSRSLGRGAANAKSSRSGLNHLFERLFATGDGGLNAPLYLATLVAAVAFGAAMATWVVNGTGSSSPDSSELIANGEVHFREHGQEPFSPATLVNVTNCRWDRIRSTADLSGGGLKPGQSLHLLEGVAEIKSRLPSGSVGRFQIEGPVAMILTSQGMPSLQSGKLAAQVTCDMDCFTLDTPLGRTVISQEASIGLTATANEVELHVFSGEVTFEWLWPKNTAGTADDMQVGAGASIRIFTADDGKLDVLHGKADDSRFVTHVSMTTSRLDISDRYVAEIRQAQPVAYWRFEGDSGGLVRNEVSDRMHCRIRGKGVRWRTYRGNRSAELNSTPDAGYLVSDETFDQLLKDRYTVEAWIKPSHFHHGTILALIQCPLQTMTVDEHGMFLEVCGPLAGPISSADPSEQYPAPGGRIRFTHRNPPGQLAGTNCFSQSPYALRRWQHVAGVKDGAAMRLYVDGQLVASGEDVTPLPEGMRILVGQFVWHDPNRMLTFRPFMGELDEVALYDRALSEAEIHKHIELVGTDAQPESPL